MSEAPEPQHRGGNETFAAGEHLDLQGRWQPVGDNGTGGGAPWQAWGRVHRPDWVARGMLVWPRGGVWLRLRLRSVCPQRWRGPAAPRARARLVLQWWAERAELLADGRTVQEGDLFDTACRWPLPRSWWEGQPLDLELRLRSPLHDDGALIHSRIEREPLDPDDPGGLLAGVVGELEDLRRRHGRGQAPGRGGFHLLGHAHLDLAWLWPVADTWRAAERTFGSVLALMERFPALHFGHSTPALYDWLERHRPKLFARIRRAMRAGRWEPLNGPWVETDCVLVSTSSLLRQFLEGQRYSRTTFPEWEHRLAWLPDSFGFSAGLPPVAAACGVRWFCTHKLAWNASNPFPHRLFRWRGRCGGELLALMTPPIGTDGDPLAMERQRILWQEVSGCEETLWLPGVGDHGGGPTAAMLEQLALWQHHPATAPQRHGTLRAHLARLEPLASALPVWRDELYLELHRGCATSRPDQKRHNRSLERLLREAEVALALRRPLTDAPPPDWRPLLFQQFHDILPGTSVPEVFDQAEPLWRQARRRVRRQRDAALGATRQRDGRQPWRVMQLQPLPASPRTVRLPGGEWWVPESGQPLPSQPAPGGGTWVQLPGIAGIDGLILQREPRAAASCGEADAAAVSQPVRRERMKEAGGPRWRLSNGRVAAVIGPAGIEQIDADEPDRPLLAAPLAWRRWRDRGEYWDAWDIAADYRDHPLAWCWEGGPQWVEEGPLCCRFVWRGRCGASPVRLDGQLLAGAPALELTLRVEWRQLHELLRLEIPLSSPVARWAGDTPGGVIERPARPATAREQARWEVPAVSWIAAVSHHNGLAVLLEGPQGVSATPEGLGISLLRAPTWPDPGADNGLQRLRLALMPTPAGWRQAAVPDQARRLREPLWCRPVEDPPIGWQPLPPLPADLQLVDLRRAGDGSDAVILVIQNLGPCRRRLELPSPWRVLERLQRLDQEETAPEADDPLLLLPWQIGIWRWRPPRG